MNVLPPFAVHDGRSGRSILLPIDISIFEDFPNSVRWANVTLLKKSEVHVTLLHTTNAAALSKSSEEDIATFFNGFVQKNSIRLKSLRGDLRYVVEDERKAIVVRCTVSNLGSLFKEMNSRFKMSMPIQPAHITLYTAQRDVGIHINSEEAIEKFEQVNLPVLARALQRVKLG